MMYYLFMLKIESFKTSLKVFSKTYASLLAARKENSSVPQIKSLWAEQMLHLLKVDLNTVGAMSTLKPLILVGNHISYLDIVILLKSNPDFSFVAKSEIKPWPIFGKAALAAETIFVQRDNGKSRASARQAISEALLAQRRVLLFPSGTTCLTETKPWKKGAFEIAKENQVLIQPFRISYSPLRTTAYIDDDFFPLHLYQLASLPQIHAQIEFHPPVHVTDATADCTFWSQWTQQATSPQRTHEKIC